MITRFNSLAPRRKILVAGVALLVFAVAGTAAVAAVSSGDPGSAVAGQNPTARDPLRSRPGPVLLVPGYGGSTGALSVLAGRIRASGRQATVVNLPGTGTGSLIQDATVLDAAVTRAMRGGAQSVDVIGYSAGGVTALLWARDDGGTRKARRVITLGSPFHGASIAILHVEVRAAKRCRRVPGRLPAAHPGQQPAGRTRRRGAGRVAVAVAVDYQRPDRHATGLGAAHRRDQCADPVRLPGPADQPLPAADQPGGDQDRVAGDRRRPDRCPGGLRLPPVTRAEPEPS